MRNQVAALLAFCALLGADAIAPASSAPKEQSIAPANDATFMAAKVESDPSVADDASEDAKIEGQVMAELNRKEAPAAEEEEIAEAEAPVDAEAAPADAEAAPADAAAPEDTAADVQTPEEVAAANEAAVDGAEEQLDDVMEEVMPDVSQQAEEFDAARTHVLDNLKTGEGLMNNLQDKMESIDAQVKDAVAPTPDAPPAAEASLANLDVKEIEAGSDDPKIAALERKAAMMEADVDDSSSDMDLGEDASLTGDDSLDSLHDDDSSLEGLDDDASLHDDDLSLDDSHLDDSHLDDAHLDALLNADDADIKLSPHDEMLAESEVDSDMPTVFLQDDMEDGDDLEAEGEEDLDSYDGDDGADADSYSDDEPLDDAEESEEEPLDADESESGDLDEVDEAEDEGSDGEDALAMLAQNSQQVISQLETPEGATAFANQLKANPDLAQEIGDVIQENPEQVKTLLGAHPKVMENLNTIVGGNLQQMIQQLVQSQ